jgi:hypothetical protein
MPDENQLNALVQKVELLYNSFSHFEKTVMSRLDKIDATIAIINMDQRESDLKIERNKMNIEQCQKDINSLGELIRSSEKSCQIDNQADHKDLFIRIGTLETDNATLKGGIAAIVKLLVPTLIAVLVSIILSALGLKQ